MKSFINLPKINSDDIFEDMCMDILKNNFNFSFQKYGRKGQKQHGIDIISVGNSKEVIVCQCKNYTKSSIQKLIHVVEDDYKASKKLPFKYDKYILMTSSENDIQLIDFCQKNNIIPWCWDFIQKEIKNTPWIYSKYYSDLNNIDSNVIPLEIINKLLMQLKQVKDLVKKIGKYTSIDVCRRESLDNELYGLCFNIHQSINKIEEMKNDYSVQLQKKFKLTNVIEKLICETPDFFEAYDSAHIIYTVDEFIRYFSDEEKLKKYIEICDKILENLSDI